MIVLEQKEKVIKHINTITETMSNGVLAKEYLELLQALADLVEQKYKDINEVK